MIAARRRGRRLRWLNRRPLVRPQGCLRPGLPVYLARDEQPDVRPEGEGAEVKQLVEQGAQSQPVALAVGTELAIGSVEKES